MALRERGIRCVLVCTTAFEAFATSQAKVLGAMDLELAVIEHPLGGITDLELEDRGKAVAGQLREWLLRPNE